MPENFSSAENSYSNLAKTFAIWNQYTTRLFSVNSRWWSPLCWVLL